MNETQLSKYTQRAALWCLLLLSCFATLQAQSLTLSVSVSTGDAGGCNNLGKASAFATGGVMPYTYVWSNGATSQTLNNLTPAWYSVTVTDANNATATAQGNVSQVAPLGVIHSATREDCEVSDNGTATAIAYGGTAPYTYQWADGQTTVMATGLDAGAYTVTVTDASGCTASTVAIVNMAEEGVWAMVSVTPPICGNPNSGTVHVSAMLGTPPYTYTWSHGAPNTPDLNNLAPGTYTVTVSDVLGCADIETFVIGTTTGNFTLAVANTAAGCNTGGSATATVNGGTPPFTYVWNTGATTASVTNLSPGTYTVTATDASGCTQTATTTLIGTNGVQVVINGNQPNCQGANGMAIATPIGGTAPYTYQWSNGANGASITNVGAGVYTVTLTDANGCTGTAFITLQGVNNTINVIATATPANCTAPTGTITATANGGTAPYTYVWNTGAATATLQNLAPGNYTVTVTDANGCIKTAAVTVGVSGGLQLSTTHINVACQSLGSAGVMVVGGAGAYTYQWSNGATTPVATNLAAGNYTVTVTAANGCSATAAVTIETVGGALTVTTTTTPTLCNYTTGSATAIATGGSGTYTYQWNTGATGTTLNNIGQGTYTVTATDGIGCTGTATAVVGNSGNGSATIGNFVWYDADGDGTQDATEQGFPGVNVTLSGTTTAGVALSQTVQTSATGQYLFSAPAGTYKITVELPFNHSFTTANATAANEATDSDINAATGMSNTITVTGCQVYEDLDAGLVVSCIAPNYGGQIGYSQTICRGQQPAAFVSLAPATSYVNGATINYIWMQSTTGGNDFGNPSVWTLVPNASGPTFQPPVLTQTMYYVRCAFINGCDSVVAESNVLTITVRVCPQAALMELTATEVYNNVQLDWQSFNESAVEIFAVSRSKDGIIYEQLQAMPGTGAANEFATYQFLDKNPYPGVSYYRVEMIDLADNMPTQSQTTDIKMYLGDDLLLAYPNPTSDMVQVETMSPIMQGGEVQLLNALGQLISSVPIKETYLYHRFDLRHLPKGVYFIRNIGNHAPSVTKRILKK